jgi:hypothetical protein
VLLEAAAGCALLIAATAALAGFVALLGRQRDQVDRRERAALVAANVLERLISGPEALTPGEHAVELVAADGPTPPGMTAALTVTEEPIDEADGGPRWLALRLDLRWPGPSRTTETLRLATWCASGVGRSP